LTEDDEAILKALEHEIEQGNIDLSDPIWSTHSLFILPPPLYI
jgi:hypothetical protein